MAALGLKRSTVHRILGVLADLGPVTHDPLSHLYLLGAGAYDLASQFRVNHQAGAEVMDGGLEL